MLGLRLLEDGFGRRGQSGEITMVESTGSFAWTATAGSGVLRGRPGRFLGISTCDATLVVVALGLVLKVAGCVTASFGLVLNVLGWTSSSSLSTHRTSLLIRLKAGVWARCVVRDLLD